MKRLVFVITTLILLSLAACGSRTGRPAHAGGAGNLQSGGVTMLDEGVWPENVYTEGLPVPPGTVAWARLDTQHGNCSVSIADMTERDFSDYMKRLEQAGFTVMEQTAEAVKGQDYVSIGTLLSDGEKALSVGYVPGSFTMYIALEA